MLVIGNCWCVPSGEHWKRIYRILLEMFPPYISIFQCLNIMPWCLHHHHLGRNWTFNCWYVITTRENLPSEPLTVTIKTNNTLNQTPNFTATNCHQTMPYKLVTHYNRSCPELAVEFFVKF